jgi:hypothetical protein
LGAFPDRRGFAGKIADLELARPKEIRNYKAISMLCEEVPCSSDQGIKSEDQGVVLGITGKAIFRTRMGPYGR